MVVYVIKSWNLVDFRSLGKEESLMPQSIYGCGAGLKNDESNVKTWSRYQSI